jgi:putative glutathione S-transferase
MGTGEDGNSGYGRKAFKRSRSHFADRITADGRDGWPVEAGRYRLVASRACPWASRALVSRRLLGLEDALSLAVADPIQDDRSWRFTLDPDGRDPVLGIRYLGEAYDKREKDYPGGVSVPAVVDVPSGRLVTNDYQRITLDLATEWTARTGKGHPTCICGRCATRSTR